MVDPIRAALGGIIILCQIVVLILAALALGGGTWIEDVEDSGDYFTRIQSGYGQGVQFATGDFHSIGMWRYFHEPGQSNPLPSRDPELTTGTACYVLALSLGCLCIVLLSYQLMGIGHNSLTVTLSIFWVVFFEFVMLLTATTVVLNYFKHTFRYERLGHSHHMAWISFSFSCLALLLSVIRVVIQATSPEHQYSRHHNGAGTYGGGQGGRGGGSEYSQPRGGYQRSMSQTNLNSSNGNGGGTMPMRPISPKSVHSLGGPYQRDSYVPPPPNGGDYRGGYDAYDMRPPPPKGYSSVQA
ncbi:uncharacterized protein LOC142336775 [Convolutriloba macropyga]|uniref:uncharacterized protein LOC142336775 n=1 Tax=Convolutriloba macropyga TaxID=536237 RepID=UPI003F51B04D